MRREISLNAMVRLGVKGKFRYFHTASVADSNQFVCLRFTDANNRVTDSVDILILVAGTEAEKLRSCSKISFPY